MLLHLALRVHVTTPPIWLAPPQKLPVAARQVAALQPPTQTLAIHPLATRSRAMRTALFATLVA